MIKAAMITLRKQTFTALEKYDPGVQFKHPLVQT